MPTVRRMDFDLPADIPAWWWAGDRELTRSADALHLLFPDGERFFIRSVRDVVKSLPTEGPGAPSAALKQRVRAFMGQEAMHGREHEAAFALLDRDGIEWRSFLESQAKPTFEAGDRIFSPLTRLAVTCALEHLTAVLGAASFSDPMMDEAHPTMRELMLWHAAEEVEHKSVAFDVYEAAGGGYLRRIFGMLVAYATLMVLWQRATAHFLEQDGGHDRSDMRALRARMKERGADTIADFRRAFVSYLRPGFHPDDVDDAHLARDHFAARAA
jgi:predicted metal-dependent hydrolase